MPTLEQAISIAASAHAGYLGDDAQPYILHPLRVMLALDDEDERVVGILHDVPEKTGWTLDNIRSEGFSDHVLEAIDAVTRRHGESYFDFVERTRTNDLGRRVKIADLNDKIAHAQEDPKAAEKLGQYEKAVARLSEQ